MKNLFFILLIIPNLILSQNGEISFNNRKLNPFFDLINNAMKGTSSFQAIYDAKSLLKLRETKGELVLFNDGSNFLELKDYTYLHIVKNDVILDSEHLGFSSIYIQSYDKDYYKENNIVSISIRLSFFRKHATNSKLEEIQKATIKSIDKYYKKKCTTGLSNPLTYSTITRMSINFENNLKEFAVFGKKAVKGGLEETNSCINDCEECFIEVQIGYANLDIRENKLISHIFDIGFTNKWMMMKVNMRKDMNDFNYNNNFVICKYKGIKGNELDLRKINNYDLKAMINFFIEDYNRYSTKVENKKITPLVFKEEEINATFETLEESQIARSYGKDNDSKIIIKVDPKKWADASEIKRWYIIYHELGHDILNLEHGEGGKMMFNFADKDYSWDDFIEDKKYMFSNN